MREKRQIMQAPGSTVPAPMIVEIEGDGGLPPSAGNSHSTYEERLRPILEQAMPAIRILVRDWLCAGRDLRRLRIEIHVSIELLSGDPTAMRDVIGMWSSEPATTDDIPVIVILPATFANYQLPFSHVSE
jgi:hypothetical protein